ncbi:MAG: amidohydrolase [Angelakisella sp.]|nr:amidohydrolase [Angelakisella sp.]
MKIRFYNGRIMPMTNGGEILEQELWVEGDSISYMGPAKDNDVQWDRQINLNGNLLLPGFKNAHTHSAMTFLRSFADDLPLLDWLNEQVFPMEAKIDGEDMYHLSRLAILEYLSSGITANFDMYFHPETVSQASIDSGFRTVMCGSINNFYNSPQGLEDFYLTYNKVNPLISYKLGFHAEYTCSEELLKEIAALSQKYQAPVYTHNSESASEVEGCIQRHGTTPTVYLESLGLFEHGGGGYHCVHMSDEDLKIMKDKGLWVISNPGSNVKLASGIARLCDMDKMGIGLALGTDGPASNNCLDMFREMFLATALQKIKLDDASAMDAVRVLEMATVGGAGAMGLSDCDVLAVGKKADLVVLDLNQPNMQPLNNLAKNIVYSGSKSNVAMTVVAGRILYEKGEFFVGEDPERIYQRANEIIARVR